MKNLKVGLLAAAIASVASAQSAVAAESIDEALKASKASGDFRLRYENVDKDGDVSEGITLRTRILVKTDSYKGLSAVVEFEDVRDVFGVDDEDGFIPDPEVTELEQGYLQYKGDKFVSKFGRQVITLDGHRYVGHVGWRQDRQTFDAFRTTYNVNDKITLDGTYIYKRNRIFAEAADTQSDDILLNAAFKTPVGKVVAYSYLLDDDAVVWNPQGTKIVSNKVNSDTYGLSFSGSAGGDIKYLYTAEYAVQSIEEAGLDYDTEYMFLEGGITASGITAKLGYEVLGSDDGKASFTTPLATLHKFNGWNDVFLGGTFSPTGMANGLVDTYVSVGTTISGIKLSAVYHEYEADEGSDSYGDEMGFVVTKGFKNGASLGLKYSSYSADDFGGDVDKLWIWSGYKF